MSEKKLSRVEVAKIAQGYVPKPAPNVCGNCAHFQSKIEQVRYSKWTEATYTKESELRCGIGGFKVGKSATCDRWDRRAEGKSGG